MKITFLCFICIGSLLSTEILKVSFILKIFPTVHLFFLQYKWFSGLNKSSTDWVSPWIQQSVIPSTHDQEMEEDQTFYHYKSYSLSGEAREPLHEIQKGKGSASLCILQYYKCILCLEHLLSHHLQQQTNFLSNLSCCSGKTKTPCSQNKNKR